MSLIGNHDSPFITPTLYLSSGGAAEADDGGAQDRPAREGPQRLQAGRQPRVQQDAPGQPPCDVNCFPLNDN